MSHDGINENKMLPFYLAIIFQVELQIGFLMMIWYFKDYPNLPYHPLLGIPAIVLIFAGIITAGTTIFNSIRLWMLFKDNQYSICFWSVLMGIAIGIIFIIPSVWRGIVLGVIIGITLLEFLIHQINVTLRHRSSRPE